MVEKRFYKSITRTNKLQLSWWQLVLNVSSDCFGIPDYQDILGA